MTTIKVTVTRSPVDKRVPIRRFGGRRAPRPAFCPAASGAGTAGGAWDVMGRSFFRVVHERTGGPLAGRQR
jgi:hypothetical protein